MDSNSELIEYLEENGYIESERVEEAFRKVDRKEFVPESRKNDAYRDTPLPIGRDATISAPHMVAMNTELLEVLEGNTVLEVGSGSGYQLAILSELTSGKVVGVERIEELVNSSRQVLEDRENAKVIHGNGLEAVDGEFDRVLFSCGIDSLEEAKEYIAEDGVLVAPVKKVQGQVLTKYYEREDATEEHGRVRFVSYRDESLDG